MEIYLSECMNKSISIDLNSDVYVPAKQGLILVRACACACVYNIHYLPAEICFSEFLLVRVSAHIFICCTFTICNYNCLD